jgi:hypothetical protein
MEYGGGGGEIGGGVTMGDEKEYMKGKRDQGDGVGDREGVRRRRRWRGNDSDGLRLGEGGRDMPSGRTDSAGLPHFLIMVSLHSQSGLFLLRWMNARDIGCCT